MSSRRWMKQTMVVLAVGSGGCAGSKPASAPAPEKSPAKVMLVARPAPLTPVAAPPELFAVARVRNPGALADTVAAWSGLPIDWRHLLAREAPEFERIFVPGASVDFAAMLDPASSLEPRVLSAFSLGVSSADAVASFFRGRGSPVTDLGGGAYRARVGEDLVCVAGPALGPVRARVVCSGDAEGADGLAPYLSRGLAAEAPGASEIHASLRLSPFRQRYGAQLALVKTVGVPFVLRELSLNDDRFDHALRDALYDLADEATALVRDLDQVELDVSLGPVGDEAIAAFSVAFSGQESASAKSLVRAASRAEPPPGIFWKLPTDAVSAGFLGRGDPEFMRPVAARVRALADGWLAHHGLSDARRGPLVDAIERALVVCPELAYASLPLPAEPPARRPMSDIARIARTMATGHLGVVSEGGDRLVALSSAVVKALADKKFRDELVHARVMSEGEVPVLRQRPARGGKGLPKGSLTFEIELPSPVAAPPPPPARGKKARPAKKAPAPEPFKAVLVAVPDGQQYWFAFGTDEASLLARILATKAGSGPTLSSRQDLVAIRTVPVNATGFTSISAFLGPLLSQAPRGASRLSDAPHGGLTPIPWRSAAESGGPRIRTELRVPRAAVEDIVALAGAASRGP